MPRDVQLGAIGGAPAWPAGGGLGGAGGGGGSGSLQNIRVHSRGIQVLSRSRGWDIRSTGLGNLLLQLLRRDDIGGCTGGGPSTRWPAMS